MERFAKCYLDGVVRTQGELFDLFNHRYPGCDTADFMQTYLQSRTRLDIDHGQAYVTTMDCETLMDRFLEVDKYIPTPGVVIGGFRPDWIGRFYALYQWTAGLSSVETLAAVPLDYISNAYRGLHDLDLPLAVEKVLKGV